MNFAGPTDSFSYTLTDGNGVTNTATVTINLSGLVWYVNSSGGNGDGRSHRAVQHASPTRRRRPATGRSSTSTRAAATTPGTITLKPTQTLVGRRRGRSR